MLNSKSGTPSSAPDPAERMIRQVEAQQTRVSRRRSQQQEFWRSLGILGLVGWSVALPTLVGAALGAWIDHRWPSHVSWTLMMLVVGLVLGCVNAWSRIKKEAP